MRKVGRVKRGVEARDSTTGRAVVAVMPIDMMIQFLRSEREFLPARVRSSSAFAWIIHE
jgi:hypothetical protein